MNDQELVTEVKSKISWFKTHEKLLALVLVLASFVYVGDKWLNGRIANAEQKVTVAEQRLEDQKLVNDKLAQQSAAQASQYQTLVDMLSKQNAALAGAIASRDAALKHKQDEIASMTLPQVAQEWAKQLNLPSEALPIQNGAVVVQEPIARSTVNQLAAGATAQANLEDQTKITANKQSEVDSANKVISTQTAQITGLNAQVVDQTKACAAEISKVKAVGRKSKIKFFLFGFVSGLLARSAIQGL